MADARVEEVRMAMALNGGISLAVWMGGCGVELDAARRAHLGPVPERPLYAALCDAFKRELVIDLMSGASAGGINGALLGAAIQKRRRLHPGFMRDKWLQLGDFGDLLHPTKNAAPASMMQGKLFAEALEKTFVQLIGADTREVDPRSLPDPAATPPALDVKLDITTTNVAGEPVTFVDIWRASLTAREHRARFEFRKPDDFTPEALGQAARSSASFPAAFEPFAVKDEEARRLAGFEAARWVVDGGLLDNAPIGAAIELIPTRAAERQVRRFLVYVNADARPRPEPSPDQPTLAQVLGHAVNLPRQAPFVDQLYAIKRATQVAARSFEDPGLGLLRVAAATIDAVATPLFDAYRQRRLLQSLEEITGDPAGARDALDVWGDGADLPWIPNDRNPADKDGNWQWGINAALRALHLLNDVLRPALRSAGLEERERLLAARAEVYAALGRIEGAHQAARDDVSGEDDEIERTRSAVAAVDPRPEFERPVAAVLEVRELLDAELTAGLFGAGEQPVDAFVERALAVEVVRRSLHAEEPVDTAQRLAFAQLTPFAPGWLFTPVPWAHDGWSTPDEKLLGLGLGHFAGFYRRSWRANDFMWGRLDAAARIVDMLVSDDRARKLDEEGWADKPWDVLAGALLPADDALSRMLVEEALATMPDRYPTPDGDLATKLAAAIEYDLRNAGERSMLTRILCTRAAQLEAFREEWPVLVAESKGDAGLGGGTAALELGDSDAKALASLRSNPSLPVRLKAADELGSTLALQTSAHAALVALGALRTAGAAGRPLFALRAFALPVAGAVARTWWNRAAVVVAFWAAAVFLAGRTLQPVGQADLNGRWSASLLVALFALLVVVGVVLVPGLRAALAGAKPARRVKEGAWAVVLALAGLGSIAGALLSGVSVNDVVAAPAAEEIDGWVLGVVIAVVLGTPIVGIPALASKPLGRLLMMPWGGWLALPLAAGASIAAGVLSVEWVWDALWDSWWQTAGGLLAFAAGPLLAVRLLVLRRD